MSATQKILLAESDSPACDALRGQLSLLGYDVHVAHDAIHAISVARREQPEAVLLCGQLAGGGPITALRRLRSNVYTTNIPVIGMVDASGAGEGQLRGAGAQDCLPRGSTAQELRDAIDRNLLPSLDFTQPPAEVLAAPERLAALNESRLLDSPPEASFDRLTRLACRLTGAPTALVSLVDKDRQFFKSQVGLPQPWAGERQTRLSHSFCQWVVAGQEALVVGDAREHPVLRSNLAIRDLGVTAYAGIPLYGRGGEAIGSFCAIDSTPRQWRDDDIETLRDLAQVAEAYARLEQARRGGADEARLTVSLRVAGQAVLGVTRTLRRLGPRIEEPDREQLLGILQEQAEHLAQLVDSLSASRSAA